MLLKITTLFLLLFHLSAYAEIDVNKLLGEAKPNPAVFPEDGWAFFSKGKKVAQLFFVKCRALPFKRVQCHLRTVSLFKKVCLIEFSEPVSYKDFSTRVPKKENTFRSSGNGVYGKEIYDFDYDKLVITRDGKKSEAKGLKQTVFQGIDISVCKKWDIAFR